MHNPILFVINSINESTSPYNEHILYRIKNEQRPVHICHFLSPTIDVPNDITRFNGNGSIWKFTITLRTALKETNYEVVHLHAPVVGFIFCLYCQIFSRQTLKKSAYTVHTSYSNFKFVHKVMAALIFCSTGKIICCSNSSKESLPHWLLALAGRRLAVIQNGVDLSRIRMQANTDTVAKNFTQFVFIGRLEKIKQPLTVLRAFSKFSEMNTKDTKLVYVGDGSMKQQLIESACKLGLQDKISILGKVPREKVFDVLSRSQYFVSASEVEGFPVAVLESIACGCSPILSNIPPHLELVQSLPESIDIPIFPLGDSDELAKIMLRKEMESQSSECSQTESQFKNIDDRIGIRMMIQKYNTVYTEISCDY